MTTSPALAFSIRVGKGVPNSGGGPLAVLAGTWAVGSGENGGLSAPTATAALSPGSTGIATTAGSSSATNTSNQNR